MSSVNWRTLERLRTVFLESAGAPEDYWRDESDLASYDATFAQRIGWKWDYVLAELQRRGWRPPGGVALDWGCGSGIASRAFLDAFGVESVTAIACWDRSSLAMAFAARQAAGKYPGLAIQRGRPAEARLVLLSHVLTELGAEALEALTTTLAQTTAVIWVEPGTRAASRRLIGVREQLRHVFHVVAPCTHRAGCGLLASGEERHWCHHFAPAPPGVFTDPFWGRFAKMARVDLRSLPLSFLVLDRRPPPVLSPQTVRVLGRVRVYKAHALADGCSEDGVQVYELRRRDLAATFRRWRAGEVAPLQHWERAGNRILAAQDAPAGPA